MMKNFFRALEACGARHMLISGQATVLYGASTFSEDVDLWVDPQPSNWRKVLNALRESKALVYKLTPSLEPGHVACGHGFHFTLANEDSSHGVDYLDIMGVLPRVGAFGECFGRARYFDTDWGRIPVIHPHDLVEIKKTRRLADYAVISALVRLTCQETLSREEWSWGLHQTFEAGDMIDLWRRGLPQWRETLISKRSSLKILMTKKISAAVERELSAELMVEIEALRERDRKYWRPIIAELKQMQQRGKLLEAGTPVKIR